MTHAQMLKLMDSVRTAITTSDVDEWRIDYGADDLADAVNGLILDHWTAAVRGKQPTPD